MGPQRKRAFGKAQPLAATGEADAPRLIAHDRRQHVRTPTNLQGKLSFGHASFAIDCLILDLSEAGAHVRVQNDQTVPESVILVRLRDRIAHEATVVWRRDRGTIGLKFESAHNLEEAKTPGLRTLRQYCVEYDLA